MKAWMAAVGMIGLLGACRSPAAPQGSTVQTKVKAETPKAAMAVPEADEDRTVTWKKAPGHPNVRIPSQFTAEQIQKGVVDVEGRGVIVFHSEAQLPNGA